MARTPRASVSKTSGQGVSRLSYQKGRSLGKTDAPSVGKGDTPKLEGGGGGSNRSYGKSGLDQGMNISYGDTYEPTDLADVQALGERPLPKKSSATKQQGAKKWKK